MTSDGGTQTADRRRASLALLLVLASPVVFAGCGSSGKKTIPRSDAATLVRQLKAARAAAGTPPHCRRLLSAVAQARSTVDSLPSKVDRNTRDSLRNGVANLASSARQDCQNVQTNTSTATTPTVTTPPTTTSAPPPPTTATTPPPTTHSTPAPPTTPPQTNQTPDNGQAPPGQGGVPPGQQKKPKGPKGPDDKRGKDGHG
jgi:hypothetical protein